MKIIICDDDMSFIEEIKNIILSKYDSEVEFTLCSSGREFSEKIAETCFDLAFDDIVLGQEDGIELVRQLSFSTPVIFITAYVMKYAEEIFKGVVPYGFIGKPISADKLCYYIDRAKHDIQSKISVIKISASGREYELLQSDIIYIESDKRQIYIHSVSEDICIYDRLDNIEKQMDERFVRSHQSFIVNMDYVAKLEGDYFILDNGQKIKISRNHITDTRRKYFGFNGRKML